MDNLTTGTILLAILVRMSITVTGNCYLENFGTYPCTGQLHCSNDFGEAVELVRDWQCRRHESYDYYSNYRRVRIDEDYDIYISASEIQAIISATSFDSYSAINVLSDHIIQMSLVNSHETTIPSAISNLKRTTLIDLSRNAIESINLGTLSRTNLKQLNVSYNIIATLEVGTVPVSVSQITLIDLSHNAIKSIPNNYFRQCPELLHLNLSHNSIESVDILTFEGITQLETLYISNNKISQLGLYFARFVHLKELFLDNNNLSSIEERNFNMMTSLDTLNISSNRLVNIHTSSFSLLVQLRNLDLSNNKIEKIPKILLEQNVHLSLLDLSNNRISVLEPGAFAGKTITVFNIQNNRLSGSLKKNTFQGIYVEKLDLSAANITELGPDLFDGLSSTVQSINISSNFISKIDKTSFSKLELLTTLDLSHNKIQDIEFDLSDLKNLSNLYINDNLIQNITKNMFKGLSTLKAIDFSNNDINQIEVLSFEDLNDVEKFSLNRNPLPHMIAPQMFSGLSSCTELHLTHTKINSLQNNAFNGMDSLKIFNVSNGDLKTLEFNTFNGSKAMETIDLSFNKIEIFSINNTQINFVKVIYLNNNRLRFVTNETFLGLAKLNLLNLEQNNIVRIKDEAFNTLKSVQTLIISANENMVFNSSIFSNIPTLEILLLYNVTAKFTFESVNNSSISGLDASFCDIVDIDSVQLYKIGALERLTLSWNKIRSIDKTTFQKLHHLSWIDLSHNKISNIQPGSFSDSKDLSILKLNNNYLTSLQFGVLDGLANLQILFLSNNILHTCKANIFHNILRLETVYLDDNIINDLDFNNFAATNVKEISIGGNLISCDSLTDLKKKNNTGLTVTAINKNYGTENVDGITCRSMINFENVSSVNANATVLTATLLSTIEQFRATVERLLNRNESKEQHQDIDFKDVSISIQLLVHAFNKSETSNSVFLSKLMEINNNTNWYLQNIKDYLKYDNNVSTGYKTSDTELKDKDIEKILSGMLDEQKESLRTEFKGMLDDLKSHNVGSNQFASQTADVGSSSDLKSALYFIATCLGMLLCVMILTLIFIYIRSRNKLTNSNSLYNSRQPISNVMEME